MIRVLVPAWSAVLALFAACWLAAASEGGFLLFYALLVATTVAAFLSAVAVCRGARTPSRNS
jgi:hypothetical protein